MESIEHTETLIVNTSRPVLLGLPNSYVLLEDGRLYRVVNPVRQVHQDCFPGHAHDLQLYLFPDLCSYGGYANLIDNHKTKDCRDE